MKKIFKKESHNYFKGKISFNIDACETQERKVDFSKVTQSVRGLVGVLGSLTETLLRIRYIIL